MKALFIVAALWVFVIFYNLFWYLKAKSIYRKFLSGVVMTPYKSEIKTLFSVAGTSKKMMHTRRTPYLNYAVIEDISQLSDDVHSEKEINRNFQETIGALQSRLFHTLNLLYVLFLFPSVVLQKLTKEEKKRAVWLNVVVSVVLWLVSAVAGYILEKYLDKLFLERIVLLVPYLGIN